MIDINKISNEFVKVVSELFPKYSDILLNNAGAEIRRRIFNEGGATEGKIGNYKPKTKLIREQLGQETSYVNLEQTGTLRRSIQVGVDGSDKVLGIAETNYENGWTTIKNAEQQERNFKKEIFTISEKEIEKAFKGADTWLDKQLDIVLKDVIKNA
jgi:hypothetical protein